MITMRDNTPSSTSTSLKFAMAGFMGLYIFYAENSRKVTQDAATESHQLQTTLSDSRAMLREPETIRILMYKENIIETSADTMILETCSEPVFLVPLDRYRQNQQQRQSVSPLLTP
jgi:hypothetical protein